MATSRCGPIVLLGAFLLVTWVAPGARAQEADDTGWSNTSLLTVVLTGGNSTTRTLGGNNELTWTGARARFKLSGGAIRSETSASTRTAVGTSPADFTLEETSGTDVTAESIFARGRYERDLSARQFLFVSVGWERNTFAGIDGRYTFVGGTGVKFIRTENTQFSADVGLTYAVQDDVTDDPTRADNFGGLRLGWNLSHVLTPTTTLASVLTLDENLNQTSDVRFDLLSSIAVGISEMLSLKSSLQLQWDNDPALESLPLEFPRGTPTAALVSVPLDTLDTVFTVGLSVDF